MSQKPSRERLDALLVRRGLAESVDEARRFIRAGLVRVDGQISDKPGTQIDTNAEVTVQPRPRFVSRGGHKLEAAFERFDLDVEGAIAADVGASTGGFTDCLLQHGAARVYAIDVGYGQLAWKLRNDPRVVVMERTNARHVEQLPEPIDIVTADVSFISLDIVLAAAVGWLRPRGEVVALIKPQFEAPREQVERGGVVRDPAVHRAVLEHVIDALSDLGLGLQGLIPSPLRGPAGNVEFVGWWRKGGVGIDAERAIDRAVRERPE